MLSNFYFNRNFSNPIIIGKKFFQQKSKISLKIDLIKVRVKEKQIGRKFASSGRSNKN